MNYHNDLCRIYTLYKNCSFVLLVLGCGRTNGDEAQNGKKETKDTEEKKINDRNDDEPFSYFILFYAHYFFGSGSPMFVDASKFDLSFISQKDLQETDTPLTFEIHLSEKAVYNIDYALAFGTIRVEHYYGNYYIIKDEKYDFDMKDWKTHAVRNIFTAFGWATHNPLWPLYSGRTFTIRFYNLLYIKP